MAFINAYRGATKDDVIDITAEIDVLFDVFVSVLGRKLQHLAENLPVRSLDPQTHLARLVDVRGDLMGELGRAEDCV